MNIGVNMRWRKVLGDLRAYRMQIILMTVVLVLGTAGVVAALNAQAILKREIAASFRQAASPDLALWFESPEARAQAIIGKQEGVAGTEWRRSMFTRIAASDGSWLPVRLTVVADFASQKTGIVHLHQGNWPTSDGGIFIEQSAESMVDTMNGVRLRTPAGEVVTLPVAGWVHDTAVAPSIQERMLYAYVSPATATKLGQNPLLDQLLVKMDYRRSTGAAYELGNGLMETLAHDGVPALRMDVLPAEHPHAPLMNAMLRVLEVLSAVAFACSAALAGYLVSAWMRREVRQVGIMKTMGARWQQIALQYFALAGPLVLLAIAVALPLGMLLGRAIVQHYAVVLNIDVADMQAPPALLLRELAFSLCIPLIAMIVPIVRAARMSVRVAIQDAGITPLSGVSRLATRWVKLPGQIGWNFALRNSWRRPWRLTFMLLGLSAGGALLMLTHSNYESLISVIDTSLQNQGHDVELVLPRALPAAQIETIARSVDDVAIAEAWRRAGVTIGSDDNATSTNATSTRRITLNAYPAGSRLFHLPVVQGRTPSANAKNEVMITRTLQEFYPNLNTGSHIELEFRGRRIPVVVSGLIEEIGAPALYTQFDSFEAITALGDQSSSLRIKAGSDQISPLVSALDRAFLAQRLPPAQIISREMVRDALEEHFKVVGDVIRMVALAAALVGAIILAATSALNVIERGREIGILRAIGATPGRISTFFLAEGAAVTLAGFALSILLSIPLTLAMLNAAENRLLHVAVPMKFSWLGMSILGSGALVVMLAVYCAIAWSLRKSVRDALAYE
ncbi:MAG: ABC transporter permease [Betaproteobacteria bacterium]